MRLTLVLLGHTLDLSLEANAADADTNSLDGGTTASTNVLYFGRYDTPEDIPLPQRTPPWDDEE
jgi:hypothetical protein